MNSEEGRLWLKEIITGALAIGVGIGLIFAYKSLLGLDANVTNPNIEKVSTALYGIFAAFVGYYAGRVPAEKAASDAQKTAVAARDDANSARNSATEMSRIAADAQRSQITTAAQYVRGNELLRRALPHLLSPIESGEDVSEEPDPPARVADEIRRYLDRS